MSLSGVHDILESIAAASGKQKEVIFEEHIDDPDFRKVVYYALNPHMRFNIKKLPNMKAPARRSITGRGQVGVDKVWAKLDYLAGKSGATNEDAMELATAASVDAWTWEVVWRIVNKDLRCGVSVKTAAPYMPELPLHELQLCTATPKDPKVDLQKFLKKVGYDPKRILVSNKMDGVRCWALVYPSKADYLSRNGKPFKNFGIFDKELRTWAKYLMMNEYIPFKWPVVFDAEVCATTKDFDKVMTQVQRLSEIDNSFLKIKVFDMPFVEGPLSRRYFDVLLDSYCKIRIQLDKVQLVDHLQPDWENGPAHKSTLEEYLRELAKQAWESGEEGLIIKDAHAEYEFKRSRSWCKLVERYTADCYVVGFEYGEPGKKHENTLGKLIVDFNGVKVGVGSGFTDAERDEFLRKQPKMIEVSYREVTKDGSLQFPGFVRVREDKD